MALSGLIHAALFAAALGVIAWTDAHPGLVTIDLGASSLLLRASRPKDAVQARAKVPPKLWLLAAHGRPIPLPTPLPKKLTATAEEADVAPPCPPPCPENAGDWIAAANLSLKPIWSDGLITEGDYPTSMRKSRKEGVVVVDVLIDASGKVRGVNLVKGSEPDFNNLVVERLAHSSFVPARDRDGHAVPCRARIPIQFQLM
jgi:TonB family protein